MGNTCLPNGCIHLLFIDFALSFEKFSCLSFVFFLEDCCVLRSFTLVESFGREVDVTECLSINGNTNNLLLDYSLCLPYHLRSLINQFIRILLDYSVSLLT
jgi:hypothetical protein